MSKNGKTVSVAAAAVLLSALSLFGGGTGGVQAQSAYPSVGDIPSKPDKPTMTVDEQSKLKKQLSAARDRQNAQAKVNGTETPRKPKSDGAR